MSKKIKLTRNKFALIDDDNLEWLSQWKWYCDSQGYAVRVNYPRNLKRQWISMARLIIGAPPGKVVDHIDGNPLNNHRENLRIVSQKENCMNRRKKNNTKYLFKGVSLRGWGKWQAQIEVDSKNIYLGMFESEIEAAKAYDEAARKLFGEFARVNLL